MRILRCISSFTIAFALPKFSYAVPDVSISRLPNGCSAYPTYDNSSHVAGPWLVVADSTGGMIDGLRVGSAAFTNDGVDRFGFITLPKVLSPYLQNITLRCANNTLQAQQRNDWVDLSVASEENWQGSLSFGLASVQSPGIVVEPYAHFINGTRQPGVYLGAKNSTTWRFKYNWGGNAGEYYLVRLLRGGAKVLERMKRQDFPVLDDRDYEGFLRVVA